MELPHVLLILWATSISASILILTLDEDGEWGGLFATTFTIFIVVSLYSIFGRCDIEYERIPHERTEVIKTDDRVVVLNKNNNKTFVFDTKEVYDRMNDTTDLYFKREVNIYGGILKEEVITEHEIDKG